MPSNVVRTKNEEAAWTRAKAAVRSQYPDLDEDNDRFWKLTNTIYTNMKALDVDCTDAAPLEKARVLTLRPLRLRYVRRHRKES